MLMAKVKFNHSIMYRSTTNISQGIPYQQCTALDPKSGQGLARALLVTNTLHWRLGVMKNGQEFLHFDGQVQVKKLVQEDRIGICICTWNIRSLIGQLLEIVDTMIRKRKGKICLRWTKQVGEKLNIHYINYGIQEEIKQKWGRDNYRQKS